MKKYYVIILTVLAALILAAGIMYWQHISTVMPFDLAEYAQFMEAFPNEQFVLPIASANEAKSAAESIWLGLYGPSVLDERPFRVYRDEPNRAWFVTGSIPMNHFGGAACILLTDNGQVLAVWHEK